MIHDLLRWGYILGIVALGMAGLHHLILLALYLRHRRRVLPVPPTPDVWPTVTLQLPIFNERHVVERLIDAATRIDYPDGRLQIQVLDDSSDETMTLAAARIEVHRKCGLDICYIHRSARVGFKGGALAAGLAQAKGELVAVLDADFVPASDFLRRLVPYLVQDPSLGMVQARWGHLNDRESWLTRCQAFALDAQFVIIQSARSWAGLLVKFNGSAGIWRRACIDDAGGWQSDTLTEDLDLSLRAQMHGWRFLFVPQVVVPAELPSHLAAYKRQQHRWAHGSTQVLRKLGARLLASPLPLAARLDGLLQVWAYVNHVIVAALLLFWLPLLLLAGVRPPSVPWVLPLALAGPLILGLAQWAAGYPDWKRRILYLPLLFLMGVGLGLNNSAAVVAALLRRSLPFVRTPKGQGLYRPRAARHARYALPTDWTLWAELGLASFALFAAREMLAFDAWLALPLVYLGGCYGFVAGWGFLETGFNRFRSRRS